MAKYRVEFDNKEIKSIALAHEPVHSGDILEEHIGETIFAIVEAENDEEAKVKAARLQVELQTRKTKSDLTNNNAANERDK